MEGNLQSQLSIFSKLQLPKNLPYKTNRQTYFYQFDQFVWRRNCSSEALRGKPLGFCSEFAKKNQIKKIDLIHKQKMCYFI
jgi:hypothetical protein